MSENENYNIGQVAKMFNVATSLIRYWESEFDIIQPGKDEKGNRTYTKEDVNHVRIVYHLVKEKGYTLEGAKKVLMDSEMEVMETTQMIEDLKKVKNLLEDIKKRVDDRR